MYPSLRRNPGYIVVWCLLMLAVSSSLIYFEQQRRTAQTQRSLSAETRMALDQQFSTIRGRIIDCARRTAVAVADQQDSPLIANRRPTLFLHYPRTSSRMDPQVDLSVVACPVDDDGSMSPPALFTPDRLAVPAGFLSWQYSNLQTTSGQPSVTLSVTAPGSNPEAKATLTALHAKYQRHATDDRTIRPFLLSSGTGDALTLTFVFARQP